MKQQQHTDAPTMSGRLAAGPISMEQALDYGVSLAKELKRRRQAGEAAAHLHPDLIFLNGSTASILDGGDGVVTRYSAPEQWDGEVGDARSDVFSFGAIFSELIAGRPAVEGKTAEEWRASLLRRETAPANGTAPSLGPLIDRCLKPRPEERWQSLSAVVVELKLFAASQRHAKAAVDWKRWMSSLQEDLGVVNARLTAHQSAHEAAIGELHNAIGKAAAKAEGDAAAAVETMAALEQTASANARKLGALEGAVGAAHEKLDTLDDAIRAANRTIQAHEEFARGLASKTETHARAIESLHSAVSQTDDVMDHVVDAFDAVQRLVLERSEGGNTGASQRPN